ncbi:hypothetical protein AB1L88_07600 [Tautonia sp. JC769]
MPRPPARLEVVHKKGYGVTVYAHRRDGTAEPIPIVDIDEGVFR